MALIGLVGAVERGADSRWFGVVGEGVGVSQSLAA
jgi:hypothetical protein